MGEKISWKIKRKLKKKTPKKIVQKPDSSVPKLQKGTEYVQLPVIWKKLIHIERYFSQATIQKKRVKIFPGSASSSAVRARQAG